MTARYIMNFAVSADGFIADARGGVSWLDDFPAPEFGFDEFYEGVDVCLMGRHTYEQSIELGDGWGEDGKRAIVLTSRPIADAPDGLEIWRGAIPGLVARLNADLLGDPTVWIVGGAKTMTSFLTAGLVDQIEMYVVPVRLGEGLPPFGPEGVEALKSLDLTASTPLDRGVTRLTYVKRAKQAA